MTKRTADQLLDDFTIQAASVASAPSEPSTRQWSGLQQAIFNAVRDPAANLMIQARAGTGKTTTICKAMDFAPGRSLFMAFNKSIADELRARMPERKDDVKTLNALGNGQWWANARSAQMVTNKKLGGLLASRLGDQHPLVKDHGYTIMRLVSLAKANAFGLPDGHYHDIARWGETPFIHLIDSYGLDVPVDIASDVANEASKLFLQSRDLTNTYDFDDQVYTPAYRNWAYPRYATVFVDEFQDLNGMQHVMLGRLAKAGARIVGVGDDHQAIYGFRGALSNSMGFAQRQFSMQVLPLSVSYRCARAIITKAQFYCPDIQWRDNAPEGRVWERVEVDDNGVSETEDPRLFTNCLVLCRNNAPLFRAILRHIRAKEPCRVLSNFLEGFQGFIRSFRCSETIKLMAKLDKWYEREREAAETRGLFAKAAGLEDKYETAKLLCEQYVTTDEVLRVVKALGEGTTGPTFSTIHKAKGLEHDHVYLLRPDLLPAFFARTPEQVQQEDNLAYVAITRAKESFGYGVRE